MPSEPRTTVIHVRDMQPGDVYIGRANWSRRLSRSDWYNPFRIGWEGSREEVIEKYRQRLNDRPDLMARLPELRGKRLACWCAPVGETLTADNPLICHGQMLARMADAE